LEHQDKLGETIEKISFEKAGIIKENIPVITAAKNNSLKVIKNVAKNRKSEIYVVSEKNFKRISFDNKGQVFDIKIFNGNYLIKTNLLGHFQGENISLSIASIKFLKKNGFKIDDEIIKNEVLNIKNPGRMEILSFKPTILLDGAHNIEGIKKLRYSLENDFKYNRLILAIGILKDKKYIEMLEIIIPVSDKIVVTKSKNKRSCNPYNLKKEIEYIDHNKQVIAIDNLEKAVLFAKREAGIKDMVCICGSLFIIGEARRFLKEIILF
jgi:dihydrofolate synthase/folylpolyglutamate synthase